VLGPVEVRAGTPTLNGGDRGQALPAMLFAARGRVVPADRLADQLWKGMRVRSEALGRLETARHPDIARLRSILGN
jgi:DNA-binding SARP family transcriptional activator